jgi:tRNA G18 (ribose-2'-O)-methylase SpoU
VIPRVGTSDDPALGPYRRVGDAQWLRQQGLFVAEGRLVVARLIESGRFEITSILVTPRAFDALQQQLAHCGADVYICDQPTLNGLTGFNFHRGCLALARRPAPLDPSHLLDARRLVGLERIGNPDNIGGIFRVAAAFGVGGVLLDPNSGDPWYRKAIRTSMAAVLQVPFVRMPQWPDSLATFQASGFRIVALTPQRNAIPITEFAAAATSRFIVLLGSEGEGLSDAALDAADVRVRIPIAPAVDSLNVVVAAGIALERLMATDKHRQTQTNTDEHRHHYDRESS